MRKYVVMFKDGKKIEIEAERYDRQMVCFEIRQQVVFQANWSEVLYVREIVPVARRRARGR